MTDLPPLPEPTWMMPESIAGKWDIPGAFTSEQMREYARQAVEAEREACARVCDVLGNHLGMGREPAPDDCAASIRARR